MVSRVLSRRARLLLPLLACAAACDHPPPRVASPGRPLGIAQPGTSSPDPAPEPPPPEPAPEPPPSSAAGDDPLLGQMPPQQPEGVPFPLPDPLPPESLPRTPADSGQLREGPAPLQGWLGGRGTADGELSYPRAVATAADGALFVCDKTGRITKWDADGRLLAITRTPAITQGKPTGMNVAPDGTLLVADTHYCRVLVYSPDLRLVRAFGAPGVQPGHFLLLTDVVQAKDGRYYATDYGDYEARLQVLAADGASLACTGKFGTGDGELRRPMAICLDEQRDAVYVADAVNHRIAVFSMDGVWRGALSGPDHLRFPYSVSQDERGRLWIAEFGGHRVSVLDPMTGATLAKWGAPGRALGSLDHPWGLALGRGDRVWVLDSGNDRVLALPRAAILGQSGQG